MTQSFCSVLALCNCLITSGPYPPTCVILCRALHHQKKKKKKAKQTEMNVSSVYRAPCLSPYNVAAPLWKVSFLQQISGPENFLIKSSQFHTNTILRKYRYMCIDLMHYFLLQNYGRKKPEIKMQAGKPAWKTTEGLQIWVPVPVKTMLKTFLEIKKTKMQNLIWLSLVFSSQLQFMAILPCREWNTYRLDK